MADSKKAHFSKSPILKIFSRKFLRFVLGLVGLIDAMGIDVAQCTLYNAILRIARNFLETRENIKISTHPFYHINLG